MRKLRKQSKIAEQQYQGLDKVFSSNRDNKNVNESLIKKEYVAKTLTKKKYNISNLIYSRSRFVFMVIKYLTAFLLNQNIHIYKYFIMTRKNSKRLNQKNDKNEKKKYMLELLNYNKYEKLLYVEKYNYNHKFQAINLRLKGMIRMNTLLKNQMIKH